MFVLKSVATAMLVAAALAVTSAPARAQYALTAAYPASPSATDMRIYMGLNNLGQVVGERIALENGEIEYYGFVYGPNGGSMSLMGNPFNVHCTFGGAINDAGRVAGGAFDALDQTYAVYWDTASNSGAVVGTLGGLSYATSINQAGQIVGMYGFDVVTGGGSTGTSRAFITDANGQHMRDLGIANSQAVSINNQGQVLIAASRLYLTGANGFDPVAVGQAEMNLQGMGLNDAGQVVGGGHFGQTSGGLPVQHAFVTARDGSGLIDLGATAPASFASIARAINAQGRVVGQYTLSGVDRAFIANADYSGLIDLNSQVELPAGVLISDVIAINDKGQILAAGSDGAAYLLTPVPEPAMSAMLALGLVALACWRRRPPQAAVPG